MANSLIPATIENDWHCSGLRLIAWSFYDAAQAVAAERRPARRHWLLYVLLAGQAALHLPSGRLVLVAPVMALLRPDEGFLEDLAARGGRILLGTADFALQTLPGWSDPLAHLAAPAWVPLADPAPVVAAIAEFRRGGFTGCARSFRGRALLDRLLADFLLLGFADGHLRLRTHREPRWLGDVLHAMRTRWNDRTLDLAGLSRLAGVDRYRLCREFRTHFGVPPMAWIRRERLTNACRLLRHAEARTVAAVARSCGYASPVVFARHFRALTGMSATAWRQAVDGPGRP